VDYAKIVNRELIRLKMSLEAAVALKTNEYAQNEIIPFLHFPPVWGDFCCGEFISLLQQYHIRRCYFGHIHGIPGAPSQIEEGGIRFILSAADHLNFSPLPVFSEKSEA